MPRGALIELTAKGQHDLFLTGTPSITFWKTVYRRHTPFSMESIEQVFDNSIDFGSKTSCTLKRSGDLINNIYFVCKLPILTTSDFFASDPQDPYMKNNASTTDYFFDPSFDYWIWSKVITPIVQSADTWSFGTTDLDNWPVADTLSYTSAAWTENVGNALLDKIELQIGDAIIDTHYGVWLDIWGELSQKKHTKESLEKIIGTSQKSELPYNGNESKTLHIPLRFWFNENPGLALPLLALSYSDVKLNFKLRKLDELVIAVAKKKLLQYNADTKDQFSWSQRIKNPKPVSPLISSSSVYDTYNIIQAYEASTDTELESYRRSGRVQNSNFQISIQKITAANGIVKTVTPNNPPNINTTLLPILYGEVTYNAAVTKTAKVTAKIDSTGTIQHIIIAEGGQGYTNANNITGIKWIAFNGTIVEHNDATKYNFAVETTTDKFGIGGVTFLKKGENYIMPAITFTGKGTGAVAVVSRLNENNGIEEIEIINGGTGYDNTTTVTVNGNGYGTNAVLTYNQVGGTIVSVYSTTPGNGYIMPIIQMNDVTGTGAHVVVSELNDDGGINTVKVVHRGLNYSVNPQINVYGNPNATGGSTGEERLDGKVKDGDDIKFIPEKTTLPYSGEYVRFYHKDDNFNQIYEETKECHEDSQFSKYLLSDVIYNSDLANESSGHDNPFAEYPLVKITKNGNNIKVFMTADYYNSTYFKNWGNFSNARHNYPILLSDRKNPEVEISGTIRGFDLPGLTITLDTTASSTNDFYNGYNLEVKVGTNYYNRFILDYDGATKKATIEQVLPNNPTVGTDTYKIIGVPHYRGIVQAVDSANKTITLQTYTTQIDFYNNFDIIIGNERKNITDYNQTNGKITIATNFNTSIVTGTTVYRIVENESDKYGDSGLWKLISTTAGDENIVTSNGYTNIAGTTKTIGVDTTVGYKTIEFSPRDDNYTGTKVTIDTDRQLFLAILRKTNGDPLTYPHTFTKNNIFLNNNLKGKGYKTGDQFLLSNASGTEITTISITADATGQITDLTIVNGVEHTAAPIILQSSCVGKLYVPQGGSQTNSGHYIVGRYYWNYKQMMTFSKRYTWVLQLGQGKDYDVISLPGTYTTQGLDNTERNQYPFIYPQDPTYQWFNSTDTPRGNFWQRKLQFAVQDPGIPHLKSGAIIRLGVSGNPRFDYPLKETTQPSHVVFLETLYYRMIGENRTSNLEEEFMIEDFTGSSLSVEEESYYTTGERIEEQNWYNGFNNTFIQNAVVENVEIDTVSHYPLIYYTLDVHALDFDNRFWFYEDYTITNSETWNLTVYPPWNDFEPGDRITPNLSQNKLIYKKPKLSLTKTNLWVDYIYLDEEERRRFSENTHEYLIEQVQFRTGIYEKITTVPKTRQFLLNELSFTVKELIWAFQDRQNCASQGYFKNSWFNYGINQQYNLITADCPLGTNGTKWDGKDKGFFSNEPQNEIIISGHKRINPRRSSYFRYTQPYQHHTSVPEKSIYSYSFAIRPEEHQPSGTLNFSRVPDARLKFFLKGLDTLDLRKDTPIYILFFAKNYNIFKIQDGKGGVLYGN